MNQTYIYSKYLKVALSVFWLILGLIFVAQGQSVVTSNETDILADTAKIKNLTVLRVDWKNTGTISTVSGEKVNKNSSYSVGNALYGLIPGLVVLQKSGEPGEDNPDFKIRGNGTFGNSNYPLILVDGFEHDLSSLAIEDIQSVSVLKDASAAILYGGKAANGVIAITTKRGRQGKVDISVNAMQGIQNPIGLPRFVNSADYAAMYNQALANDGMQPLYTNEQIQNYKTGDPAFYPSVDWIKELVKSSTTATRANVNASGGNKIVQYYASIGYLMQNGIYNQTDIHDGYSTNLELGNFTFRSNLDVSLTSDWKLSIDMYGQISDKNSPYESTTNIWNSLYQYPSLIPMYAKNDLLGGTSSFPKNPMGLINEQGYRDTHERSLTTNFSTVYDFGKIVKGLVAGVKFGYDNSYGVNDAWTKTFESFSITGKDAITGEPVLSSPFGANTNLSYVNPSGDNQSLRFTLEGHINYRTKLGNDDELAAKLVYHQDKLTLGPESPYYFQSVSGLFNYNLRNRYIADLGFSYCGSEAFKKGNRFSFFPSVSAGWIVSNESFIKNSSVFDFLKLRASAGVVGRSDLGLRFAYRDFYKYYGSYVFGTGAVGGISENDLSNPDLTFERANKYEIGLESILLNNIQFAATYYYQKRTNILVDQTNLVPSIVGVGLQSINSGSAESQGVELSLGIEKSSNKWGYHATVNYTFMKSKVLFNAELPVPEGSEHYYRSGHPISQPYGLDFIGFFQSQEDIDSSPIQQFGEVKPGDMKYRDRNNDGYINKYDEGAIGNSMLPKSEVGIIIGGNYKMFDVQCVVQAQLGRDIYLGNNSLVYFPLVNDAKISTYVKDQNPWTEENKESAGYPRLTTVSNTNNYRPSTFWYKDADFVRLRSVEVGYNFPHLITSKFKTDKIRLFFRGTNLLTFSKFTYGDPETMTGYPAMRSLNAGINVQF